MKTLLIEYIATCDKRTGIRYLNKRNPELWQWVLDQTKFLPTDAKPKQRVWHIVNDTYKIPVCPVDSIPVKWHENRYLEYSSLSAKARCPRVTEKRIATYKAKTGFSHWHSNENTEGLASLHRTYIDRYGATRVQEFIDKTNTTKAELGIIRPVEERDAREIYNEQVKEYTKESWYYHYSKINPDGITRGRKYHLDHIYSRKAGFDDNVPAEVIGHWTNLRMMPGKKNNGKGPRCDKTLEQLFEDYEKDINSVK